MRVRLIVGGLAVVLASSSLVAAEGGRVPAPSSPAAQTARPVRVTGVVRDEQNAITLPGVPVEVVGQNHTVYTDMDGRYALDLPPGSYELKVTMDGYADRTVRIEVAPGRAVTADVLLAMNKFAEEVTVTATATIDAVTSTAEAQLIERKNAQVISDNVASQEMKANGDGDAAQAMSRVTGLSVVDNQYVFVRGLGERYSNTTLAGSVIPTTEPDKKVVSLDLFPAGLINSVQVTKSYSPDRSAEFAGGLVQIEPLKFPSQPVLDLSYGLNYYTTATGESIPLSPLGRRDVWGYDADARALPAGIPANKIVRRGVYTPDVGFSNEQITDFGRLFENRWRPVNEDGKPGQNWSVVYGNRFDKLGVVGSMSHSYKEQFVEEDRRFFRLASATELEPVSDYHILTGSQKAQLGAVGNVAYQFSPSHRIAVENFYTHSGRDEGRTFEGLNTDASRVYRNFRLQFIEEGLTSNAVSGEHFFQNWSNSRIDWRASFARANRNEPDLRETLYESTALPPATPSFVLADESQSGYRQFIDLSDDTTDVAANWGVLSSAAGRPANFKFGFNYVERTRDFQSRRFHFIPITSQKADTGNLRFDNRLQPEEIFTPANIGVAFRLFEETLPRDGYV
jgi:hypothetical protein